MSSNIEKFDLLVANLLADLYERFPVECGVSASSHGIAVDNIALDGSPADNALQNELDFFCSTMRWLKRSGYIDYSRELNMGGFDSAVLTAKALEILKATPTSLQISQPLGDYLADNVRSGAMDAAKQGVTAILSAGGTLLWSVLTK